MPWGIQKTTTISPPLQKFDLKPMRKMGFISEKVLGKKLRDNTVYCLCVTHLLLSVSFACLSAEKQMNSFSWIFLESIVMDWCLWLMGMSMLVDWSSLNTSPVHLHPFLCLLLFMLYPTSLLQGIFDLLAFPCRYVEGLGAPRTEPYLIYCKYSHWPLLGKGPVFAVKTYTPQTNPRCHGKTLHCERGVSRPGTMWPVVQRAQV